MEPVCSIGEAGYIKGIHKGAIYCDAPAIGAFQQFHLEPAPALTNPIDNGNCQFFTHFNWDADLLHSLQLEHNFSTLLARFDPRFPTTILLAQTSGTKPSSAGFNPPQSTNMPWCGFLESCHTASGLCANPAKDSRYHLLKNTVASLDHLQLSDLEPDALVDASLTLQDELTMLLQGSSDTNNHSAPQLWVFARQTLPTTAPTSAPTKTPTIDGEVLAARNYGPLKQSTTNCSSRNMTLIQHALKASRREGIATAMQCIKNRGLTGYLELCCSLHNYEVSGYGNQLYQFSNSMQQARNMQCDVLCLPDCTGSNLNQKSECGASLMWHKEPAAHIVSAMKLGLSVPLPRALPRPADLPPGYQNPETTSVTCMDGWRQGQNGGGFPYCFFDSVHWPQAKLDLSSVAVKVVESDGPLAPDALVIHIRSGDSVMQVNDWLMRDATEEDFPEGTGITCAPLQPGCEYFVDAALTGFNGGLSPFSVTLPPSHYLYHSVALPLRPCLLPCHCHITLIAYILRSLCQSLSARRHPMPRRVGPGWDMSEH